MKMQTRKRTPMTRAFGIILSLAMAAAIFPGTAPLRAAAEGETTEITTEATVTTQAVSSWDQLSSAVSNAAINVSTTISIEDDITVLEQMEISSGKDITIKLNGHTLDANDQCRLFSVESGGQLTIISSSSEKGTLKDGNAGSSSGGGAIDNSGNITIENVIITKNSAEYGGAINNETNCEARLTNVEITDNTTTENSGGAIDNKGILTLNHCTISQNTAQRYGGGIYNTGQLNIIGGSITRNESGMYNGGGIYNADYNAKIYLKGNIAINSNHHGDNNDDLYRGDGSIIINGNIESGSEIYVSSLYLPLEIPCEGSTTEIPDNAFYADSSDCGIEIDDSTKSVWLRRKCQIDFNSGQNNGGTMKPDYVFEGEDYTLPECGFTPKEGFFFAGWQIGYNESDLKQPGDVMNSVYSGFCATAVWKEGSCVTAASLTLSDDIGVNLYFQVADSLANDQNAYMTIKGPNDADPKRFPLNTLERRGDCYVAKISVNSAQMAAEITYKLFDGDDKQQTIWFSDRQASIQTFTYSVNDYINAVKKIHDEQQNVITDKHYNIVTAMQNYGAWARQYLINRGQISSNIPSILPNELSDIEGVDSSTLLKYAATKTEGFDVPGLTMTLLLESNNSIRLYYSGNQITVSEANNSDNVKQEIKGDKNYVKITDIAAQDLDKVYKIEFAGHGSISVCALSYAYNILKTYENDDNKSDICNTVKALYKYYLAANDYFDSQSGGQGT
ncbi:MAG: right-handed parallel beta-helix repeat-containing protein [Ruminococcus sp.]|nr:right-handed parallel beta-helix repeat-containing protein [Ruminococcus sp.]